MSIGHLDRNYKDVQASVSLVTNVVGGLILVRSTSDSRAEALATVNAISKALQQNSASADEIGNQAQVQQNNDAIVLLRTFLRTPGLDPGTISSVNNQISQLQFNNVNLQGPSAGLVRLQTGAQLDNNGDPISPTPVRDAALASSSPCRDRGRVVRGGARARPTARARRATSRRSPTSPACRSSPRCHGRGPEVVEAFRTLRTNLMFLEGAGQPRTIALLSPNADAGKSFCSIRLAESALSVDAQVVLVDADLRKP